MKYLGFHLVQKGFKIEFLIKEDFFFRNISEFFFNFLNFNKYIKFYQYILQKT